MIRKIVNLDKLAEAQEAADAAQEAAALAAEKVAEALAIARPNRPPARQGQAGQDKSRPDRLDDRQLITSVRARADAVSRAS